MHRVGGRGGRELNECGRKEHCLWPRQPQQYSWNGDLGQRSKDYVTIFNMCPTCYFSWELMNKVIHCDLDMFLDSTAMKKIK